MSEIILSIVILILTSTLVVSNYISAKEREKLLKLFKAKDLREVTDNEFTEKMKPKTEEEPDIVEVDPNEESIFDRMIKVQTGQDPDES